MMDPIPLVKPLPMVDPIPMVDCMAFKWARFLLTCFDLTPK